MRLIAALACAAGLAMLACAPVAAAAGLITSSSADPRQRSVLVTVGIAPRVEGVRVEARIGSRSGALDVPTSAEPVQARVPVTELLPATAYDAAITVTRSADGAALQRGSIRFRTAALPEAVVLGGSSLVAAADGTIKLGLACPAATNVPCRGAVTVRAIESFGALSMGTRTRYEVQPGRRTYLVLQLDDSTREAMTEAASIPGMIELVAENPAQPPAWTSHEVTIGDATPHVLGDEENMHPRILSTLDAFMRLHAGGQPALIASGFRTRDEQMYYWRQFQAGLGPPAAVPGTSKHEASRGWGVARAADVWIVVPGVPCTEDWCSGDRQHNLRTWLEARGLVAASRRMGIVFPYGHEPWHMELAGL